MKFIHLLPTKSTFLAGVVGVVLALPLSAQTTVFFADYDDAPANPATAVTGTYSSTGGRFEAIEDTGNLFGAGTLNGILAIQDVTDTGEARSNHTSSISSGRVSFQMYETSGGSGNDWLQIKLRSGSNEEIRFANGEISRDVTTATGAYNTNEVVDIDILFNGTGSSITQNSLTVAGSTFDVYVNGGFATSGSFSGTGSANRTDISSEKSASPFYLDNFEVSDQFAVIPEPGTFAPLSALLALGWIAVRRRRG